MADRLPSYVMFTDLKRFGRISHYDAARILLSDEATEEGQPSPRTRVEDRTYLSRQVVNAAPGQLPPAFFADFYRSAQTVLSLLFSQYGGDAAGRTAIQDHYAGAACEGMRDALALCGIDANIYVNLVRRVMGRDDLGQGQRLVLLVMLFLIMGCLADPAAAVSRIEEFLEQNKISRTNTEETTFCPREASRDYADRAPHMGLIRIFPDNSVRDVVYPLRGGDEGTLVGALSCKPGSITDVDADVSARHLLITSTDDVWYATGLGSTNGTAVMRPGSGEPVVVEPPRSERPDGTVRPTRIKQGDILCLGSTTRFMVVRLAD